METKTHIDKLRNPNYLGGWDLMDANGKTIDKIVTIKEIKNESVFNQKSQIEEQVITLFFNECKPIILNATNRKTLKKVTSTEYIEDMIGKKIQLTTKRIKAFGEFHDAIRIATTKPSDVISKPVSIIDCKHTLNNSKTLVELQNTWASFTLQEQNTTEILAEKDRLKLILK
jgi:DNA-binding protein